MPNNPREAIIAPKSAHTTSANKFVRWISCAAYALKTSVKLAVLDATD